MQYSQEHLKTMVYAEFGGETECIMGNWKIENKKDHFRTSPRLETEAWEATRKWPILGDVWQI